MKSVKMLRMGLGSKRLQFVKVNYGHRGSQLWIRELERDNQLVERKFTTSLIVYAFLCIRYGKSFSLDQCWH